MKAAQLRQSILQAAVQGKLVPQNIHDEPADKLLERIRAEKVRLVKEVKIKKEKPLPTIAEDGVPYDLPDGWVWCRLGSILYNRDGERKPVSREERNNRAKKYDYYGASGIIDKIDDYLFDKPLLLIGEDGANLLARSTPIAFIATGKYWVNNHAHVLDGISFDLLRFVEVHINAIDLSPYVTGTAQPKMNQQKMNTILIGLPPFAEQQRIVAKVDELMALCDELEIAEKELDKLETDFAEYLPKSILQAAVQGKLVPQNTYDEPADELLERIRAEKARLVKEGKIKTGKPLPPITEDEKPYDLPEGWIWCRLGEIIDLLSGRDLASNQYNDQQRGIPYITGASSIDGEEILINRWTTEQSVVSNAGDLLLSCKGTVGKIALNNIGDCHIARQIMALQFFSDDISKEYVKVFLMSYVQQLIIQAKSMIPGISREDVLHSLMLLPPFAEQQRIVAKVDELMTLCDELKLAKDISLAPAGPKVIPFPTREDDKGEEIGIAARGDVQSLSDEAMRDIDELFGDEAND